VPSNVRSFKFNIFDGQPKVSTLGFHIDPEAFRGQGHRHHRRGHRRQDGRAEFAVLDRTLVTEVPDEGAKVQVEPYVDAASTVCARTRPRSRPSSPPTASPTR
jgi:hypothetical protein